jgi:hypothetical protein
MTGKTSVPGLYHSTPADDIQFMLPGYRNVAIKQPETVQNAKVICNAKSCIVPQSAYSFTFTTKDTGQYQISASMGKDTGEMF